MRDFKVRNNQNMYKHETGRVCDDQKCKGKLNDTIMNIGENPSEIEMEKASRWAEESDLCIVLGSSLSVNPAADIAR